MTLGEDLITIFLSLVILCFSISVTVENNDLLLQLLKAAELLNILITSLWPTTTRMCCIFAELREFGRTARLAGQTQETPPLQTGLGCHSPAALCCCSVGSSSGTIFCTLLYRAV